MRKLAAFLLGTALVLGTATLFAQEQQKEEPKKEEQKKKGKKKKSEKGKEEAKPPATN